MNVKQFILKLVWSKLLALCSPSDSSSTPFNGHGRMRTLRAVGKVCLDVFIVFLLFDVCFCLWHRDPKWLKLCTVLLTEATWIFFGSYRCFCYLSCFIRISSLLPAQPGGNTAEVSCCNLTLWDRLACETSRYRFRISSEVVLKTSTKKQGG